MRKFSAFTRKRTWAQQSLIIPCPADKRLLLLFVPTQGGGTEIIMKYTKLGNTDIEISKLCVGCMSFGKPSADFHEWTLNQSDTEEIVCHALNLGINFFDTANTYSHGTSE